MCPIFVNPVMYVRTIEKGKVQKVPLEKMPIIDIPFHRIAVDVFDPIFPLSD